MQCIGCKLFFQIPVFPGTLICVAPACFTGGSCVARKTARQKSFDFMMTLPGALPLPLRHPPVAMVPKYRHTIMQEFPVREIQKYATLPGGAGLVQAG